MQPLQKEGVGRGYFCISMETFVLNSTSHWLHPYDTFEVCVPSVITLFRGLKRTTKLRLNYFAPT